MNTPAEVTTDDGDRVSHGWSQLDISKHACNTIVSSLDENDYVAVITYSDSAKVILEWSRCDAGGKLHAMATIDSMRPERSTNLMAGLVTGLDMMKKVPGSDDMLQKLSLNLIVCTDGMPSPQVIPPPAPLLSPHPAPLLPSPRPPRPHPPQDGAPCRVAAAPPHLRLTVHPLPLPAPQWHPARGRDGYAPLVGMLIKKLVAARGAAARPQITTIGLGGQLDSELLMAILTSTLTLT